MTLIQKNNAPVLDSERESNPLPKECNHESTIDVGLVPHSSSPLSLDEVSGDSIRVVAFALIRGASTADSDAVVGRRTLSQAQHSIQCSLA